MGDKIRTDAHPGRRIRWPKSTHILRAAAAASVQAVTQLRKSFPAKVTAETLKKLGIAPNNESYIINILRFIKVIDEQGQQTKEAKAVFSQHEDAAFQKGLSGLVEAAYSGLFQLHGEDPWTLSSGKLITYFRNSDHTSAVVGQRQASAFQALAALSGHGDAPAPKPTSVKATAGEKKKSAPDKSKKPLEIPSGKPGSGGNNIGMTVRIEINLPAAADQETYDKIFKSIRENLLRGEWLRTLRAYRSLGVSLHGTAAGFRDESPSIRSSKHPPITASEDT